MTLILSMVAQRTLILFILTAFLYPCQGNNIPFTPENCNAYYGDTPITLKESQTFGDISLTQYIEVEFELDIHSFCFNPSGNWGYDAICSILRIGDVDEDRYPVLWIANRAIGNTENFWDVKLKAISTWTWGDSLDFENINVTSLTSIGMHHIYVGIEPRKFTSIIDDIERSISYDSDRYIPNAKTLYVSANGYREHNATMHNLCIRTHDTFLYTIPTLQPTLHPTIAPSKSTSKPTLPPTWIPTLYPTLNPTPNQSDPTLYPSSHPTINPTSTPTKHSSTPSTYPIKAERQTTLAPSNSLILVNDASIATDIRPTNTPSTQIQIAISMSNASSNDVAQTIKDTVMTYLIANAIPSSLITEIIQQDGSTMIIAFVISTELETGDINRNEMEKQIEDDLNDKYGDNVAVDNVNIIYNKEQTSNKSTKREIPKFVFIGLAIASLILLSMIAIMVYRCCIKNHGYKESTKNMEITAVDTAKEDKMERSTRTDDNATMDETKARNMETPARTDGNVVTDPGKEYMDDMKVDVLEESDESQSMESLYVKESDVDDMVGQTGSTTKGLVEGMDGSHAIVNSEGETGGETINAMKQDGILTTKK